MPHVVLLGDSIFDNAAYVGRDPDLATQLRSLAPRHWKVKLLAVDGAVVGDVSRQIERIPADASHIVLSAGGNDALAHLDILYRSATTFAEVLSHLATLTGCFQQEYAGLVQALAGSGLPLAVSTVYEPRFPEPEVQRLASLALRLFNDAIIRTAVAAGVPFLDLRLICDSAQDYANPIEPSARGGAKIAEAILRMVTEHDFARRRTEVFT
jgi:hypothetical protein